MSQVATRSRKFLLDIKRKPALSPLLEARLSQVQHQGAELQ